jgi:hypothetical protein
VVRTSDDQPFLNSKPITKRDQYANDLEDLFDFDNSLSLNTPVIQAQPPQNDCTPQEVPLIRSELLG